MSEKDYFFFFFPIKEFLQPSQNNPPTLFHGPSSACCCKAALVEQLNETCSDHPGATGGWGLQPRPLNSAPEQTGEGLQGTQGPQTFSPHDRKGGCTDPFTEAVPRMCEGRKEGKRMKRSILLHTWDVWEQGRSCCHIDSGN